MIKSLTLASLGLCSLLGAARLEAAVTLTTLHRFVAADGTNPYYGLTAGPDGTFYGTCYGVGNTGANSGGTVFKINPDGTGYTVLHAFTPIGATSEFNTGGANPLDGPIIGTDGNLYGCTYNGGSGAYGVIYKMATNGANETLIAQFNETMTGVEYQQSGIIQGKDGFLYGAGYANGINSWLSQVYKIDTNGNNYANLEFFTSLSGGGGYEQNPLLSGHNGNLYGVAQGNGNSGNYGAVFMLTPSGAYTDLHDFAGTGGPSTPSGGLIEDNSGTLYGTTTGDGTSGYGTVFRIGTNGTSFTVLHNFGSSGDGQVPVGRLLLATDGNLYGATLNGGNTGNGTLFRMGTNGSNYQVLYNFTGSYTPTGDHGAPNGCLIQTANGTIYGMTGDDPNFTDSPIYGLQGRSASGLGTIFQLTGAITVAAAGAGIQAINRVYASPTNLNAVQWLVVFSGPVTNVNATNFQLAVTGLTGSPAITSVTGSGTTWTVTASTGAGMGTLQLNLTNAAGITPALTNTLPYAGLAYTIDLVLPTVAISAPSLALTSTNAVTYTVTYADANFNASTLAAGNVTVNTTGTASASSVVVTGTGTTRTVTLSGLGGNGTLGISLAAGTASDTAGNKAPASGPSATFTVDNTPPTLTFSNLSQTYSGGPESVTATTTPPGLTNTVTYNGSANAPTNAGSYTVIGTVSYLSFTVNVTNTLVIAPAAAAVNIVNLSQTYDGTGKSVSVVTVPAGLTVNVTYSGSASAPTNAGSYAVVGTIGSANYTGAATNTLVIAQAAQTINFGALPPYVVYGDLPFTLTATASSGLPVSFSSGTPSVASVSGGTVTVASAGSATLTASQAGNTNYLAATNVNESLVVSPLQMDLSIKHSQLTNSFDPAPILTVIGNTNRVYSIIYQTNLLVTPASWSVLLTTNLPASPINITITEPAGSAYLFYRLQHIPVVP